jgi:hypothetical protein
VAVCLTKNMINSFFQPYPFSNSWREQLQAASVVTFVVVFILLAFEPFGTGLIPTPKKWWVILGYGIICWGVVVVNYALFGSLLSKLNWLWRWKVYQEVLFCLYQTLCVGVGNYFFEKWADLPLCENYGLGYVLSITLVMAAVPVGILNLLKYNYLLQKNLAEALVLNKQMQHYQQHYQQLHTATISEVVKHQTQQTSPLEAIITLKTDDKDGNFTFAVANLLFASADDNYIDLCLLVPQAKIQKYTLRTTLKNMETALQNYPHVFRCHRSYLVNLQKVQSITGNSQGYRLTFAQTAEEVPVARNIGKTLKEKLEKLENSENRVAIHPEA